MHDMQKQSAAGHGGWQQCKNCGATKHSGFWWLAGYKSKDEPLCKLDGNLVWKCNAKSIIQEIV